MTPYVRRLALLVQKILSGFDSAAEEYKDDKLTSGNAPIFLIGSPRTGSTLLFQLLVAQYRVAYLSNALAIAPRFMVRICRTCRHACIGTTDKLESSQFGFVPGLYAPNEAGQIMRNWFASDGNDADNDLIRGTVAAISAITQAPLFLKNQANTLRIARIERIFSFPRLLLLRRDLRWTAQSLLLARRRLLADDRRWWSVAPPGYEEILREEPIYQVLWQADRLEKIALDACLSAPQRAAVIDYEALCENPSATLAGLADRFGLRRSGRLAQPLSKSNNRRLTGREWSRLEAIHDEHFAGARQVRDDKSQSLRIA